MKNLKIFIAVASLALASCGNPGPANTNFNAAALNTSPVNTTNSTPVATPADELASGRSLYQQNCANCHKEDGTGGKMTIEGKTIDVDDLTSEKIKKFDDAKITRYIHDGIEDEGMPAFKDTLNEAQIRAVVTYVRVGIQKIPGSELKPAANP